MNYKPHFDVEKSQENLELRETKDIKGGISAASWFLGGKVKGTVTCQATPDGVLAEKIRKAIGHSKDGQQKLVLKMEESQ